MLKYFQWNEGYPLVDIVDWDLNYSEDCLNFINIENRWDQVFKSIKMKSKFKIKKIKNKHKNINASNCYFIVDFKRFYQNKLPHFPKGNFNIFMNIAHYLVGGKIAQWVRVIKIDQIKCIIAIDRNVAKLMFSIIISSWKYLIAFDLERKSPAVDELESHIISIENSAEALIAALTEFNDNLFNQALERVVPLVDNQMNVAIHSKNNADNIAETILGIRNTNYKSIYIKSLLLIPKMMNEIKIDITKIKDGRRGSVVNRTVGSPELLLYSKALLLIEQYGINRNMYNKKILITCVAELLRSFAFGTAPPSMKSDDERERLSIANNSNISRVLDWRSELDDYASNINSEVENGQYLMYLRELLRGPGPAWRAQPTEK